MEKNTLVLLDSSFSMGKCAPLRFSPVPFSPLSLAVSLSPSPDVVVAAEPADMPRKSSLTAGHKKGSMHYMKRDGKEDTSTFVIQEGTYYPTRHLFLVTMSHTWYKSLLV